MEESGSIAFNLIFILIWSLPTGVIAYLLAKEKERNVVAWTIIGLIPIINFFSVWFFVGATNLRLERKIDELRHRIG